MDQISSAAENLIIYYEVGSRADYDHNSSHPTWPGLDSGITIGFGYDLAYEKTFSNDWSDYLNKYDLKRLGQCVGIGGPAARGALINVHDITIGWDDALSVFQTSTIPQYYAQTLSIYPALTNLPEDAQGALVSLVYNRGTSLIGERRTEMDNITHLVANGNLQGIANELRSMKRLWPTTPGLQQRREAEAKLVESCIKPSTV